MCSLCWLPGQSLVEAGESYKHLAEIKYNLEDNVKQNFIEPLQQTQNKDLKEVNVSCGHLCSMYLGSLGTTWFQCNFDVRKFTPLLYV